jgi:hypothetical protein
MKKVMFFAAIIACAAIFVSCDGKEEKEPKKVIDTYHDAWSGDFTYSYDSDGRVTSIARVEDWGEGPYETTYTFTYSGTTCTVNEGETLWATLTLNSAGYATKMVMGEVEYGYTYNSDNRLTGVTRNGEARSTATYQNGNLVSWTDEEAEMDTVWRTRNNGFTNTDNKGGIFSAFCEKAADGKRWFAETGLFGEASAKLCETSQWDNSENVGRHQYVTDVDGYVTKNTYYEEEVYEYTWKELK